MSKIIVIEGTDGCGKKTQLNRLFERLESEGKVVKSFSFPNYDSPSSAPLKMYLAGEIVKDANSFDAYQTSSLFAVDRVVTMQSFKDFLTSDGFLILDRYVQSNMIHQAGKILDLDKRNDFLDWVNDFEFGKLKLPKPDLVLFLDVAFSISQKLISQRPEFKSGKTKDIHEQDAEHLKNAYEAGKYVSKRFGWSEIDCTKDDCILSIDEIHEKIYEKVVKLM